MADIRIERPGDAAAIRIVNEKAFGQSAEANIVDSLRENCRDALSFVATQNGQIVGHILFTPVTVQTGSMATGMGLAPMAVLPEYQRRGIGIQLVESGLQSLHERSCPFVIVIGHPEYYPRFGFIPASKLGLRCQWDGVPDEAFMVLVLDDEAMVDVAGDVRYRSEFDEAI